MRAPELRAAGYARNEMHFRALLYPLVIGVVVDLAVDGHGHLFELGLNARESALEGGSQLQDARRVDGDLAPPTGVSVQSMRQVHDRHAQPAATSPSSTRGGDNGSRVNRTPVTACIALATAASGGTIGTSPTPRTP